MQLAPLRLPEVVCFYRPEQVCSDLDPESYSKSPIKPKLVMDRLIQVATALGAIDAIKIHHYPPFEPERFLVAHLPEYVEAFFQGVKPLCERNQVPWSQMLADSVRYTNSSLYHAQEHALFNPSSITFSPTSGFHHAQPEGGFGFCSFSGQVIAAVELYRKYGVAGAWIDLDGHFGNSIEDSRKFIPELAIAIPTGCNINPYGTGKAYLSDLGEQLAKLKQRVLTGEINWIAFAQGADSHYADDLAFDNDMLVSGRLNTKDWMTANKMVYEWVTELDREIGKPIPLTIALFGGYRSDDFQSVIELHVANILTALKTFDPENPKWSFDLTLNTLVFKDGEEQERIQTLSY